MNHILMKVLSDLEDRGLEIAVDDAFIFGLTGFKSSNVVLNNLGVKVYFHHRNV